MNHTIFTQFLRNPLTTGAICASSPRLAIALLRHVGIKHAGVVAELGPGTGAITKMILRQIPDTSDFFAVELNTDAISLLQKEYPGIKIYNDSASNLRDIISKAGKGPADLIVSGLPWAIFPDQLQEEILSAVVDSLAPDGSFSTFAYIQSPLLARGRHFRDLLYSCFPVVEKSPVIWQNMPPAFVYRCRKSAKK